jgi:uncharacterized membrane protein HdeD (DUF308 family)
MKKIEIVIGFMRHIAVALVLEGILATLLGVLVLVYPELLSFLVGLFLIATGVVSFASAMKVYRYSKFSFEV